MELQFTQNGLFNDELTECGEVMFLSKSSDVEQSSFDNVVQIIDEAGNEVNCTIDKFIEIFDSQGLEGFIM